MRLLVIFLVFACPHFAFAQSQLAWKFKPGDTFVYERIVKSEQATVAKGQNLKQEVRSTWVYRYHVTKTAADSASIQATIEQVVVQHVAGTTNVENKLLEKSKGATFALIVAPRGEISALDGYDKLIAQIVDKNEAQEKTIRQLLPEAVVRQELQDVLTILPKEPVAAGSRWQREGPPLVTPPLGRFLVTLSAVHDGVDRAGHHRLAGTIVGKYERPEQPFEVFRVVGGNLTLDKGQWSCVFDNDAGRAMNQKSSLELRGELTVELQGIATPVEVTIRREVATRLVPREKP